MKVAIVYLRVVGKSDDTAPDPSYYKPFTDRFVETYIQHLPNYNHQLIVVNCGTDTKPDDTLDCVATDYRYYNGKGWDNGAYQYVSKTIDADLMVCMATPCHLWRCEWLEPIVNAFRQFGPGLYGPMASYENHPHIRTSCFACPPSLFNEYPEIIDTRDRCIGFESRSDGFSAWVSKRKLPVLMVTESDCYTEKHWRTPDNIFRRGNQRNCLVWDRHTDIYSSASPETKVTLENAADGIKPCTNSTPNAAPAATEATTPQIQAKPEQARD